MTATLRISLLDLGVGNLRSVERALTESAALAGVAAEVRVTSSPEDIARADRLVMPGQGAFRDGSRALDGALGDAVREALSRGTPYLGICLGLQLLFGTSDEAPGRPGLGVLAGNNVRLTPGTGDTRVKIPHMGWNEIELARDAPTALRAAVRTSSWFSFVHSFHAVPDDPSVVMATCNHGENVVTAAIAWRNIVATQFHPEKSQRAGLDLIASWLGSP